ncbi:hypothetical protein GALMADRAFT_814840 [Galerina marginata CBS 339.88]|uniref:Secretion-regulating guanine nucleotide exchange factor n=1 Tax=Galerina marginata (strain CBS 339.88) TaxID=685588 RepID=A0A067STG7_GALM3|nr:hypothetical protein GALMADRAFT_814840 [Galerina marginata CBS 339.88]
MLALLSAGSNAHGQLGNGSLDDSPAFQPCSFIDLPPHALPIRTSQVLGLACGGNHTLILLEMEDRKRVLWGSGDGRRGQLGLNYQRDVLHGGSSGLFRNIQLPLRDNGLGDYSYKFVAATWETSYVVLSCEGKVDVIISLGSDDHGDLGVNGLNRQQTLMDFHVIRFDHILPQEGMKVDSISSGQRHVIVHLRSGSSSILVGWGTSRHGQLGQPTNTPFSPRPRIVFALSDSHSDQKVLCALGIQHTVVFHESDRISGLGSDRKGQLQVVKTFSTSCCIRSIGCTWNGSYLVVEGEEGWEVRSSGSNSHGQLGWESSEIISVGAVNFLPELDARNTSIKIACGSEHVVALVTPYTIEPPMSQVWGWGWNEHGNLGIGHTEDLPAPVKLWPASPDANGADIRGIWAGCGTSWICCHVPQSSVVLS